MGRLVQVVEHLRDADGVSWTARRLAPLVAALGGEAPILVRRVDEALRGETRPLPASGWTAGDVAIGHHSGHTALEDFVTRFPGRIVLYFHNVTPPSLLTAGSPLAEYARAGWAQLPRIARAAAVWVAPSRYNLDALAAVAGGVRPAHVAPPPLDVAAVRAAPADPHRLAALRARGEVNLLFVGRLVPNKRQDRLLDVFERYRRIEPRSRLHLVGDPTIDPAWAAALAARARGAPVELPGKVSDAQLAAYHRSARVFVCLSRHEGLCLPPLTAMAHGVPVVAAAEAALPDTLGGGALLVHRDDPPRLAELIHLLARDEALRARLADAGRRHLARFAPGAVAAALRDALAPLGFGGAGTPPRRTAWGG